MRNLRDQKSQGISGNESTAAAILREEGYRFITIAFSLVRRKNAES
jgi:hypothetical protein